ncbi:MULTISPECIES: hypothetical protein [Mesonia]|uniref:Uncharacterized protein n=1 Tax=Mesonia oceanica TaxID=2687242 RepID=A0AC61Y3X5_9FLAO|nr:MULTISPECIES: hypothetical protein [Mesonia]MAN28781.1 hypothetical protein [Mesonia sp.]MAQ41887.1 hypothetical protein [Mesonia sp.]MBJ98990.1 hypothetical protein [Flavobacteriaceae bacterium]VVU99188.1 hypothetical protein FVB9532_00440 [Mesonia oceanica]|tara:strand:+ start:21226 stop:21582 length:357 start_codon:yes stop_codon:yes gene_type:complete
MATQPFSGNRKWGIFINENNNFELYTKAVDVAKVADFIKLNPFTSSDCDENTYYNIAEATWENMQEEIKDWIEGDENYENSGGQAVTKNPEVVKVDKNDLKHLLESENTITIQDLGCN